MLAKTNNLASKSIYRISLGDLRCDASPYQCHRKGEIRMKTLRQVPVGGSARVVKLYGEGAVKRRIMDMGITKGVDVRVRKVAPLGDPIEVTVRGYELSIRLADAQTIEVE